MELKKYIILLLFVLIYNQVRAQVVNKYGEQVLENVQNTSDLNKPISDATQSTLDLKADLTLSNLSSAATARTNIGAAIGFDVQAYNIYLEDLADGLLSANLIENAITTPGTIGEVWTSDGSGSGTWSLPATSIIQVGSGLVITGSGTVADPYIISLPLGGTIGQALTIGTDGVPVWEDTAAPVNTYYLDADDDGYGNFNEPIVAVSIPSGYVTDNTDCDDTDSAINTTAPEICDGIDNNCDGSIDEGFSFVTYYRDADNDGYGSISDTGALYCLNPGVGYSLTNNDCDDTDAAINPSLPDFIYYIDSDGDGYGDVNDLVGSVFCINPGGYSKTNDDCDDADSVINPGRAEIGGNSVDENCDGNIYVVGDYVAGGVVIYIAPTPTDLNGDGFEDFGLVCSIDDLSTGIRWSSDLRDTNALGENVGTGKNNTDIITGIYGNNTTYAAGLANAYTGGGYSDWFLPSKTAVKWMYNNKVLIEATAVLNGGSAFTPPSNGYWSSSEANSSFAWRVKWSDGRYGTNGKVITLHAVRAIRAF